MAQYFYIRKDSTLNPLRMELVNDGKYDFMKGEYFDNAIQNASVTFSMTDENGDLRISKAPCNIIKSSDSCFGHYIIEYQWNKRDVRKAGQYKGKFEITFNNDIYEAVKEYRSGNLVMPIYEDLIIFVKD